ncbi:THAP domain-containing protein 9, partial [Harpegnathos saltator]
ELKQFACTLHFYSPAAYEYVRKTLMKVLPHQSTIRNWLSAAKYDPGISIDTMKYVSDLCKNAEAGNKKLYFSLTCDEMAIRKLVEFDGKQWHGYVNIGDDKNEINDKTEATNVLVFMLVGINSYFKIVIAYYLIHSLTGKERRSSLRHKKKIPICNITFDGANINILMVEILGAKLLTSSDELITHFKHPVTKEPITVMLDAVHMLKLVRNTLAAKQVFTDINGNCIAWKYLTLLVETQGEEELHLVTKTRHKHTHVHNEKMKVRLAAQTFSSSVAKALKTCEKDFKLVQFQGATPTAEFCQIINDTFDLLNSRNLLTKNSTQRAISIYNFQDTKIKMESFIAYIAGLQDIKIKVESFIAYIAGLKLDTTPIIQTRNKTGFLGIIICLKSVIFLAEVLFAKQYMTFLLTYKLSQDHLETFFSCIRRCGGFNNNPTVKQFIAALKKLHAHVNINIIFNSNCIPKDDTILLKENITNYRADENNFMEDFIWNIEHDYIVQSMTFSDDIQADILAYIAGFIAKQTTKKLSCHSCIKCLKQKSLSKLQTNKVYSMLFNASEDVIKICKTAGIIIRTNEHILTSKNILKKPVYLTLTKLKVNELFTEVEHAFDQAPLMDHRNQLIRILLNKFFILRLHH